MYHGLSLILVNILRLQFGQSYFKKVSFCFLLGVVLFSGSIYGLATTDIKWLGPVTPIGGTLMIIGWAIMVYSLFTMKDVELPAQHNVNAQNENTQ